jgi:FlaA1/EpsC-like NDP-sugar epimerase
MTEAIAGDGKTVPSPLMRVLHALTHTSAFNRVFFFLLSDSLIIALSLYISLAVHSNFISYVPYPGLLKAIVFYFICLKILSLAVFRVYKMTWRYVGISDLANIFIGLLVAELVLLVISLPNSLLPALAIGGLAKRIFFVDGVVSFGLIVALRVSKRIYLEVLRRKGPIDRGKNTLIIGAGNAGEMMLRDMVRHGYRDFYPVGFLDDDPTKVGARIHGVSVLGATDRLEAMIPKHQVQAVVIAIPTLNHKTLRSLYDGAKKANVTTIKIVPRIYDFSHPDINMKTLEDISIEDLVGRQAVSVDYHSIGEFIRGKSVLITGAGGSIGSEIVVQVCAFGPGRVILFDNDETELHNQGLKLRRLFPHLLERLVFMTGDVRDEARLREVFETCRPRVVFHAAAYKHVPMMEHNPKEAAKVNIFGTYALAGVARDHGVEKFVMISTDKAVRPTSVMGATKRMAEHICQAFNEINGDDAPRSTRFMSVRFGNVLGSRGSVLPLFLEQIKHGGPLTVTDREMKRYFMTIPEAVALVLQASILGNGGEVFVLDMGEPVHIVDIAEELIRIHGLEPYKDIDIQITGLRPGEKLFEEILTAEEGTDASRHEKIFIARNGVKFSLAEMPEILKEFSAVIEDPSPASDDRMKQLLRKYVKYYN